MKLFNFKKKEKTWQELKIEQEESERIKKELNKLNELNKEIELPKIEIKGDWLSENELNKELKKYPKKNRKRLRELYKMYQRDEVLIPCEDIDNKAHILSKQNG